MSKVLLTLVYYLFFVPASALVRLFHDPLDRAWDADRESYWSFGGDVVAGAIDDAANRRRRASSTSAAG